MSFLWKNMKYMYLFLFFVFLASGIISFFWMVKSEPLPKPPVSVVKEQENDVFTIDSKTEIEIYEIYDVCERYKLNCKPLKKELSMAERTKFNGLTIEELKNIYKLEDEKVQIKEGNKLVINLSVEGLCPQHQKVWHLGPNKEGDYVAVYYGPSKVKNEGGLYKVTEIPIKKLPREYAVKIKNYELEFYQKEELVATLDSFSEFLE